MNGIPTTSGGTHENGLKSGIVKAVRNYLDGPQPRAQRRDASPPRTSARASSRSSRIYIPQPQFQGQTKERLNNPEVHAASIDGVVRTALENCLLNATAPRATRSSSASSWPRRRAQASRAAAAAGAAQDARSRTG